MLKDQYERAKTEKDKKHDELKQERKIIQPLENKCSTLKKEKDNLERDTRELVRKNIGCFTVSPINFSFYISRFF